MSDTPDSAPKKRRIIHWDPEHGATSRQRRWTPLRILGWTVGGFFGLLLTAGLVIRGVKLVFGPQVFQLAGAGAGATPETPGAAFVSQSKAELARENASKAMAELRKLPTDHDSQLQRMILLEKAFLAGDSLLQSGSYARAYAVFDELNRQLDAYALEVKLKEETRKAYDEVLARMKDLDRARSLAPQEFEAAFADAGMGRQLFNQGSFALAKKEFDRAFAALDRAAKALEDFVGENLRVGQEAVATGQRDAALAAFQAALSKDPDNEMAQQGVKRAEVADRVVALLKQGTNFEEQKQFKAAAEAYAKAFEIDAFSAAAQQGKSRAERLEKETEFNAAIAAAEAAKAQKDWSRSIAEYERALKVYPNKDEVKKALADARATAHHEAVKAALARAYDHENKYEWEFARASYNATLQLDANHEEAKEGYARTGRMIRTLLQYDKLVEVAEQRAQKAEFQAGIRAFNEAMAIKPAYLALTDRVEQLRTVLMSQSQPVDVSFQSDGDTWISISTFRMLGRIRSETVKMLPGDYEIVGRRKGYQDVVLTLQVRNGNTPPVVNVVCTLRSNR
ncbi:MAG TPA: hypothetical protein VEB66_02175 [Opitutaceae bacterium]|nr:hypothetical protein [Opitutaceae bacterium]